MPSKYGFQTRDDRVKMSKLRWARVVKHNQVVQAILKDYFGAYYPEQDVTSFDPQKQTDPDETTTSEWGGLITLGEERHRVGLYIEIENDPFKAGRFRLNIGVFDPELSDEERTHRKSLIDTALKENVVLN